VCIVIALLMVNESWLFEVVFERVGDVIMNVVMMTRWMSELLRLNWRYGLAILR
jgi:hypothetical protein